ncbi:hypothetical protein Hanom_Chr16g01500621 [Helianthus anomalus]
MLFFRGFGLGSLRRLAGILIHLAHSFCHSFGDDSSETPVSLFLASERGSVSG